jgi:two-component system phosphate regulon response regulator PhoB
MTKETILVVDSEKDSRELVKHQLSLKKYNVICAETGEKALSKITETSIDLVILDLILPGMDGLEVTKALKQNNKTRHIPVIMLTAKSDEEDIVAGLSLGGDDYITKPFSPKVLLARVMAVLRRYQSDNGNEARIIQIHDLLIHPGRRSVKINNESICLTHTEFQVLYVLAKRPGWVFTRTQLIDATRGDYYSVMDRSIDVIILRLRKKLKGCGNYIETVRGIGYRLKDNL